MTLKSIIATLLATVATCFLSAAHADDSTTLWFTTWLQPPTGPAPYYVFAGATTRQTVHISLGGSSVRLRISNVYGTLPLVVGTVHIAVPSGVDTIVTSTDTPFTFAGSATVTIPAGASVVSDPTSFTVQQNTDYLVSIYTPAATGGATTHGVARHLAYVSSGNNVSSAQMPNEVGLSLSTFFISGLDVAGTTANAGVVTIGDSITDGFGATPGTDTGWPDDLSVILAKNAGNTFAIANDGASSSQLLQDTPTVGLNQGGLARLDRDVFSLPGVRMIFLALGINDLGAAANAASPSSDDLIAGYKQLVARAHERNIMVYGATITPAAFFAAYPVFEQKRQAVNAAIRAGGIFDGVIDFDAAVRDPNAPGQLLALYASTDNLHPNSAGYQAMANIIGTGAH